MEVLSGRVIVQPSDPEAAVRFYRDQLGLAIAREYPGGVVFHAGSALIEVAAHMGGAGIDGRVRQTGEATLCSSDLIEQP